MQSIDLDTLTAQDVVDYAATQGITLQRGRIKNDYPKLCARHTIAHMMFGDSQYKDYIKRGLNPYFTVMGEDNNSKTNLIIRYIEAGFEGWEHYGTNNKFYQLGQEIARLAGYDQ